MPSLNNKKRPSFLCGKPLLFAFLDKKKLFELFVKNKK
jgi:hypothetical protein